jgi:hypothetical protein
MPVLSQVDCDKVGKGKGKGKVRYLLCAEVTKLVVGWSV